MKIFGHNIVKFDFVNIAYTQLITLLLSDHILCIITYTIALTCEITVVTSCFSTAAVLTGAAQCLGARCRFASLVRGRRSVCSPVLCSCPAGEP